jgi:small subunit ribosomal protein S17
MKNEKIVKEQEVKNTKLICNDIKCPFHGELSLRGRVFRGEVKKKFSKRIVIEFERTLYLKKYERYAKSKTKLHARLPDCLADSINVGDYIEINECRPLSKIISFVVTKKIRSKGESNKK